MDCKYRHKFIVSPTPPAHSTVNYPSKDASEARIHSSARTTSMRRTTSHEEETLHNIKLLHRVLPSIYSAKASHTQLHDMPLRRDTQALRRIARIPLIQWRKKHRSREEKSTFT